MHLNNVSFKPWGGEGRGGGGEGRGGGANQL